MNDIVFQSFQIENEQSLRELIQLVGWNDSQIEGQLSSIKTLANDSNGYVLLSKYENEILGYVSVQFYEWNKLGQIHGLVVNPNKRRQHIATKLVEEVEEFMKAKEARGIYVDTPVDNKGGIRFYEHVEFKKAYTMPEYYDKGKDGVTYIKFF
jgi:ribosomal protein S18 acetylase RimI-like enzyme